MSEIDRLEKLIKSEIDNNIKLYNNHNIYLIDIKEICNKNNIDFNEVCIDISNIYDRNKYKEYKYLLVTLQVYVMIRNENKEIDYKFYEKLSEFTGIDKDELQNKIIPLIQKDIWKSFFNDMEKQNIYVNVCEDRQGPYQYVIYPKSQIYYTIGIIKKIIKNFSPYHEYNKVDITHIIKKENILDENDFKCAVEQVYTYYKIHGIIEDNDNENITNKEDKENKVTKFKNNEIIGLIYNQDNSKPIIYKENDNEKTEIDINDIIKNFDNKDILLFRKINSWQYEYSKYYYLKDKENIEYAVIISKRYYDENTRSIIKINNSYYFIPKLEGKIKEKILRINEENNIDDSKNEIIFKGGIKIGKRQWLKGYGPKIANNESIFINGEKVKNDYLTTCKSGIYTIRTKYDMEKIEIVEETINKLDYNGWEIDKDKIIASSEKYNMKGLKINIENKISYAKKILYSYSGYNIFKGREFNV